MTPKDEGNGYTTFQTVWITVYKFVIISLIAITAKLVIEEIRGKLSRCNYCVGVFQNINRSALKLQRLPSLSINKLNRFAGIKGYLIPLEENSQKI